MRRTYLVLALVLASCQACLNGFYGWEQAGDIRRIITTVMFFCGDMALICLAHKMMPNWLNRILSCFALGGFAALSIFSAAAFLIGQQYSQDNWLAESRKAEISRMESYESSIPASMTSAKRQANQQIIKLQEQIDKSAPMGGYTSGSGAIYHYIAKAYSLPVETVSLAVRMFWSFVFCIGTISLASMGGVQRKQQKMVTQVAIPRSTASIADPRDVGDLETVVISEEKYKDIRQKVLDGALQPGQRTLKAAGVSSDLALVFLRRLRDEGIIQKTTQGYRRIA